MIFDMRIDLFVKKDLRIYRRIFLKGLGVQSTFSRNLFSSTNSKDQKSDNTFDEVVKKIRVENRLKVLFFGSDTFSSKVFKKLFDSKDLWNQMFVVTPPISKRGRGQREIHKPPLLELAEELNVNFQSLSRSGKDALNEFQVPAGFQDDTVLITASFPYFIPSPIISSFQTSFCLNVHPSLLPLYRGPAPIQWQIYNQEQNSGVTVQDLSSKGFDLGKILAQRHVPLPKNSGYYEVESFFAEASGELLCEVLANLKSHAKFAKDQDSSKASYAPKVNLNHSKINSKSSFNHVRSKFHAFSHRYPIQIQLNQQWYQIRPMFDQKPTESLIDQLKGSSVGTFKLDKQNDLVGLRLLNTEIDLSIDDEMKKIDEDLKDIKGKILMIEGFKAVRAGSKGWVRPSAWFDSILNQEFKKCKTIDRKPTVRLDDYEI